MTPDATTGKIRDKNKSWFDSRQAVRSNPFMSKEARGCGKSEQQKKNGKKETKEKPPKNNGQAAHSLLLLAPSLRFPSLSPLPSSAFPLFVFWFASSPLAARFTSRNLLASSWPQTSPPPAEPLYTTALPLPCAPHLSRRACRLRNSANQLAWSRVEPRML